MCYHHPHTTLFTHTHTHTHTQHTHTGPLTMVKGNREIPCTGLLFKTYFAIADRPSGSGEGVHLRVLEYGMIPLGTAQLHKCVDVEGQTMQPDLQSGRSLPHIHTRTHTCTHTHICTCTKAYIQHAHTCACAVMMYP